MNTRALCSLLQVVVVTFILLLPSPSTGKASFSPYSFEMLFVQTPFEYTEQYEVQELEKIEKIDELLENNRDWRYFIGRYKYAESHRNIPKEMKMSMRAVVMIRIESLKSKQIISESMAQILAAEFDYKIGISTPPARTLTELYNRIAEKTTLLESLLEEGKICRLVCELAQRKAENNAHLLEIKKPSILKNLKIKPYELQRLKERLANVLSTLNGLYIQEEEKEY